MSDTVTRVTITALPPLRDKRYGTYDGRYRIYRPEHVAFDALPAYAEGGPATVALEETGWCVSYTHLCAALASLSVVARDDGMVTLSAFRQAAPGEYEYHSLHGERFASGRDACRVAYDAGLIGFMVFERDAARLGLPAVAETDALAREMLAAMGERRWADLAVLARAGQDSLPGVQLPGLDGWAEVVAFAEARLAEQRSTQLVMERLAALDAAEAAWRMSGGVR